ncbi:hypothetical protein AA313_de0204590 [Arthrobotrys entomopaga]|nr:hypothetical protein AA313_de0204590 [Arthrobotrys entomopaga]
MLEQDEKGRAKAHAVVERVDTYLQQRQRKRKRMVMSSASATGLYPRQEVTSLPIAASPNGEKSLIFPPSIVTKATTTYTNPGFVIIKQCTTFIVSSSTVVQSQITVLNLPPSQTFPPANEIPSDNDIGATGLLIDTAPTTLSMYTKLAYRTLTSTTSTPTSTARASPGMTSNNNNSNQSFSPVLIFVIVLVIILGGLLSTISLILYKRSKRRAQGGGKDQENLRQRKPKNGSGGQQKNIPKTRGADSPLPTPLPMPVSPAISIPEFTMTRKPSALLPSPMTEFPMYPAFPAPPNIPRKSPYRTPIPLIPPVVSRSYSFTKSMESSIRSIDGTNLRLDINGCKTTPPNLQTNFATIAHGASPSSHSPDSRHKSFISTESAIDPELSFTVYGSRLSSQVGEGSSHVNRVNGFTFWGDYSVTNRTYSPRKSIHGSPKMMSPRLSPLDEDSIWEEAFTDVNFGSNTPTDGDGSARG